MSKKYPGGYLTKTPPTVSTTSAQGVWTLEQAEYYQNAGQWPVPPDPYFNQVSLLLHGDGTNGGQNNTFLDSSTNNFTITRNGNVAQGTFSPFSLAEGQWSNYFDGSGDYLSIAETRSLDLGGSNFCVEAFVYYTDLTGNQSFLCQNNFAYQLNCYKDTSNVLWLYSYAPSYNFAISLGTVAADQWYHVVCCRTGNTVAGFLNGVRKNTASFSGTIGTGSPGGWYIGCGYSNNPYFTGYVSNVRFVIGSNPYDATQTTLTVPTAPLTAISGTQLLTCQSNRFKDNSSNNFTITPAGDTKVTAFSPFAPSAAYSASTNGGSGYFDGSGDYLSTPNVAELRLGAGDFTVEAWINPSVVTNSFYSTICGTYYFQFVDYGWFLGLNSTGKLFLYLSGFALATTTTLQSNTWTHVAAVRSGTTITLYINGVSSATGTSSIDESYAGTQFNVGTLNYAGSRGNPEFSYKGYLSNLRIVKGTAVYTANFTPPTAPLTAVTNTQLLLNCTNAGIYDNAGKNDIETVGDAQISTSVKKYGTGSMYFDGTGDWLKITDTTNTLVLGTGDFTIEMWVYATTSSGYQDLIAFSEYANVMLIRFTNADLDCYIGSAGGYTRASGVLTGNTNKWMHLAFVRTSSVVKIFVDGVQKNTNWSNTTDITPSTKIMYVCGNASGSLNGYIDDLRITKGVARYTADFTPPNGPFPNV